MTPPINVTNGPRAGAVHEALAEPSRRQLLELLRAGGPADVQVLAGRTGLHVTTIRSHLDRLAQAGLVTARPQQRGRRGRPRILYSAVPDGADREAATYQEMVGALVGELARSDNGPELAAAAGRAWGEQLAGPASSPHFDQVPARLVDVMETLGFGPAAGRHGNEIVLTACPLLDVATRHPEVVCTLHRGLLEGLAVDPDGRTVLADLRPFATERGCVVELEARAVSAQGGSQ